MKFKEKFLRISMTDEGTIKRMHDGIIECIWPEERLLADWGTALVWFIPT